MSSAPRGLAPREGLELGLMKTGRIGPLLSHVAGRRQASLGTPIPRTPTAVFSLGEVMDHTQADQTRLYQAGKFLVRNLVAKFGHLLEGH